MEVRQELKQLNISHAQSKAEIKCAYIAHLILALTYPFPVLYNSRPLDYRMELPTDTESFASIKNQDIHSKT